MQGAARLIVTTVLSVGAFLLTLARKLQARLFPLPPLAVLPSALRAGVAREWYAVVGLLSSIPPHTQS